MEHRHTLRPVGRADWSRHQGGPGSTPFHSWEWLSWFAPLVECRFVPLAVFRGDVMIGLAPMLLRRQWVAYTANLVPFPFLGPLVPADALAETAQLLLRWSQLRRVVRTQLTVYPSGRSDTGTLRAAGFDEEPIATFAIDLRQPGLQETFDSFTKDVRNAFRRSQKNGVTVSASTPDDLRTLLPRIHREVLGELTPYTGNIGAALALGSTPFPLHATTAWYRGAPVGVQVTIGGSTSMGWLVGVLPEARDSQASTALIWDAVQWSQRAGYQWFDLGSAPTPGNAAFKRKFNAVELQGVRGHWQLPGLSTLRQLLDSRPLRGGRRR